MSATRWLGGLTGPRRGLIVGVLRALPAMAWLAAIFYFSHQARPLGRTVGSPIDAVAHFVEYAVLVCTLWLATVGTGWRRNRPATALIAVAMVSILYAGLDELHQGFVAGRSASAADFVVDVLAVVATVVLIGVSARGRRLWDAVVAATPRSMGMKSRKLAE